MKWIFLYLSVLPLTLFAQEDVSVRMQLLSHQGEVVDANTFQPVVGERITLAVDVMTNTWFTKAPRFPHLVIRDMIAIKGSAFATNFSERVKGVSYAVQRREYSLFPQRSGSYTLHGIEVEVQVADGSDRASVLKHLRTEPLQLSVRSLPANHAIESMAAGKGFFTELLHAQPQPSTSSALVADDVRLSQTFPSSLEQLKVGDIVERRVSIHASGTLGMLIPPMHWPQTAHFSQRSLASDISDRTDRGEFVGTRTEIRHYTLLNEGQVTLPALRVSWWDGIAWRVDTLAAQSVMVHAAANRPSDLGRVIQLDGDRLLELPWGVLVVVAIVVIFILGILWRFGGEFVAACVGFFRRISGAEWFCWWRLAVACCGANATSIVRDYYAWRAKSVAPLRAQPDQWAELWSELSRLAARGDRPRIKQRRKLWGLFVAMRRADGVNRLSGWAKASRLKPAEVSLKPLNPK